MHLDAELVDIEPNDLNGFLQEGRSLPGEPEHALAQQPGKDRHVPGT